MLPHSHASVVGRCLDVSRFEKAERRIAELHQGHCGFLMNFMSYGGGRPNEICTVQRISDDERKGDEMREASMSTNNTNRVKTMRARVHRMR